MLRIVLDLTNRLAEQASAVAGCYFHLSKMDVVVVLKISESSNHRLLLPPADRDIEDGQHPPTREAGGLRPLAKNHLEAFRGTRYLAERNG